MSEREMQQMYFDECEYEGGPPPSWADYLKYRRLAREAGF